MPKELDYEKLGIPPPSVESHGTEVEIAEQLQKPLKHEWRQEGSRLYCVACPWQHATETRFTNYLLQGTDEAGAPILKKLA